MVHHRTVSHHGLDLGEKVLEVVDRWDRRLEVATAAWAGLSPAEQRRREAELDAAGEVDEWVVVLWNWWNRADPPEQDQLRDDVAVLSGALWAAAADGRLDGPSEEADSARHLLRALDRVAAVVRPD
jgi:hypothetical protein